MNKENVPESEMDEIDKFITQVDSLFERLDPPSPLMPDDPEGTWQEYMMRNRLIICFPNLKRKEREMIHQLYFRAYIISIFSVDEPDMVEEYGPDYKEKFVTRGKEHYATQIEEMESYGLRAKLSSFQERLLDRFIEICPVVQW